MATVISKVNWKNKKKRRKQLWGRRGELNKTFPLYNTSRVRKCFTKARHYYPHFADGKTEAWDKDVTCFKATQQVCARAGCRAQTRSLQQQDCTSLTLCPGPAFIPSPAPALVSCSQRTRKAQASFFLCLDSSYTQRPARGCVWALGKLGNFSKEFLEASWQAGSSRRRRDRLLPNKMHSGKP